MTDKLKPRVKLATGSLEERFLALGAAAVLATASVNANATIWTTQGDYQDNLAYQNNLEHEISSSLASRKIVGADMDDDNAIIVASYPPSSSSSF